MTHPPIDLKGRAHRAVIEAGFHPDFPTEVGREIQALRQAPQSTATSNVRDLRSLLWSSIDNDQSRDLDQIEYVERLPDGTLRLLVGIAEVDALVPKASATDRQAGLEATSVYTGVATFPMLPTELSTDLTSLLDAQERLSLVVEMHVQDSGEVGEKTLYPAQVRNQAKLTYSATGAWLEGRGPLPAAVANVPGMEAQLRLQCETSERLRGLRKRHGALTLRRPRLRPWSRTTRSRISD
jgi:exoribonuclease-2